jgi:hypothetical protein
MTQARRRNKGKGTSNATCADVIRRRAIKAKPGGRMESIRREPRWIF